MILKCLQTICLCVTWVSFFILSFLNTFIFYFLFEIPASFLQADYIKPCITFDSQVFTDYMFASPVFHPQLLKHFYFLLPVRDLSFFSSLVVFHSHFLQADYIKPCITFKQLISNRLNLLTHFWSYLLIHGLFTSLLSVFTRSCCPTKSLKCDVKAAQLT